jgi:ADP-ribosylglycohydrolase
MTKTEPPIRPGPERAREADRFRGCLLGGAVGDALGAAVEFDPLAAIRERFGPAGIRDYAPAYERLGAITDDTQMTLFTAEGLLRAFVRASLRGVGPVFESVTAHAYLRWLRTQGERHRLEFGEAGWLLGKRELHSRRSPGNTCLAALKTMKELGAPADNESKGCGGVMRMAPVALFVHAAWPGDDERATFAFELGANLAGLTHGHVTGKLASGAFVAILMARPARVARGDRCRGG